MGDPVTPEWSEERRAVLEALLDRLIPPAPERGVPGAGELGLATTLERRTGADPAFGAVLTRLLDAGAADDGARDDISMTEERVARLERDEPEAFAALLRATYMAYYSRPDVRAVLGLSPLPTQPHGYAVPIEPPELLGALLGPVRARGRCYRPA